MSNGRLWILWILFVVLWMGVQRQQRVLLRRRTFFFRSVQLCLEKAGTGIRGKYQDQGMESQALHVVPPKGGPGYSLTFQMDSDPSLV